MEQTNQLVDIIVDNNLVELVLDNLDISYRNCGNYFTFACPIHEGDNSSALNIYINEEEPKILWRCHTQQCHHKFGRDFIGFVRGTLETKNNRKYSRGQAIYWLSQTTGINLKSIKSPSKKVLNQREFIKNNGKKPTKIINEKHWCRDYIRQILKIPSTYYLNRGYSEKILDKYDIGYYNKTGRVVVPIYDQNYKWVIGFTGRSLYEKCIKCGGYHQPSKVCPVDFIPKWRHSKNFIAGHHLFNLWFAKPYIQESKIAILVEGVGDSLRLIDNGINNVVALFRAELTINQETLLHSLNPHSLIILLDNDKAGLNGANNIKERLGRLYRLYFPKISKKDIGELNSDEITSEIKTIINSIKI